MTERIIIGDENEWVDVSSSGIDKVAGRAMDSGQSLEAALADLIKESAD
jgi:hypothetical protein